MSALSRSSPLKRKQQESGKPAAKPKALFEVGNEDWPCLDTKDCKEGRLKVCQQTSDNKEYVTCDHNVWKDPSTCKVCFVITTLTTFLL